MAQRSALMMLGGGTVAVLVALFLLWQSMRSEGAPHPVEPPAPSQPSAAAPTAASNTPSPTAAPVTRQPTSVSATAGRAPTLTPAPAATQTHELAPVDAPQHPFLKNNPWIAQTKAVEPLVRECIDKAVAAGVRPTGTAMLTYIVAKHGDKYEIEDTGIDDDKTTIQNPALLECLHQTSKAMKFEALPRDAHATIAARSVTLQDGKLTESRHVTFSYLR
jgi:hypothetical protein